jgi:2-C-methyl-D-erythritol 4-phosphate cytidylyltransferase
MTNENNNFRASAVIAAGGMGLRMGGGRPKQFLSLCGEPLLARALRPFCQCAMISEIVIAAPAGLIEETWDLARAFGMAKVKAVTAGGAARQDSVRAALEACSNPDIVVIHDGVRPFASVSQIEAVAAEAAASGACALGVVPKDTVRLCGPGGEAAGTLDRGSLRLIQTPQGFDYRAIVEAHLDAWRCGAVGTDDAWLVERLGKRVSILPGSYENIKVTTPEDLSYCEWLLRNEAYRTKYTE